MTPITPTTDANNMNAKPDGDRPLLTDDEIKVLVVVTCAAALPEGVSVEQLQRIVDWAETQRLGELLLRGVLTGQMYVMDFNGDGEACFGAEPEKLEMVSRALDGRHRRRAAGMP